jgi:hypothetical protein
MKLSTLPSPSGFLTTTTTDIESNSEVTASILLGMKDNSNNSHHHHQSPLYHRQHSRNRSLDSAQVQSYLQFNVSPDILDDLNLNSLQLHLVAAASKSSHTPIITNDRILSLKQQNHHFHYCRLHRDSDSSESPELPPPMGVVVVCPSKLNKCTCACAASSDDSGICSGASGTTGSETDDVTSSVACEDDPNDDTDGLNDFNCGSPRLSFDSAIIMTDGDGDHHHEPHNNNQILVVDHQFEESTDTLLLNNEASSSFINKCREQSSSDEDLERTLTNNKNELVFPLTLVTEVSNTISTPSTTTVELYTNDTGMSTPMTEKCELPVVIENVVTPSSGGTSLFSRIRVNSRNSKPPSTKNTPSPTTTTSSGSGSSNNITTGMRSKLRLNFGNKEKKSKGELDSVKTLIIEEKASSSSKDIKEPAEDNQKNAQEVNVFRRPQPCKSWLLRFFESQVFNMSYAIGYLFSSKEPGVQQYIGMCTLYIHNKLENSKIEVNFTIKVMVLLFS